MLKRELPRIVNMGLRGLALGSKFALIFVMAKYFTAAELGQYGLFLATISFSVLIVGADYYTYSQRELLASPKERWSFIIQHQVIAISLLYLFLLPLLSIPFWFGLLPVDLIFWFYSLLIVEHAAQEIYRLLIAMFHPLLASWLFLIRFGLWVWVLLPIIWFYPQARTLDTVYLAWLTGSLLSVIIGLAVIWREVSPWKWYQLDNAWLKKGFGVGLLFLGATLCFKGLLTLDRYVVEYLAGPDFLGVYVLFMGMVMAVIAFLDSAVFSFLYPRLVTARRNQELEEYHHVMKELAWSTIIVGVILAISVVVIAPSVLEWIDRPIYIESISMLWLLLVVSFFYGIGMIPHYGLYANGDDRGIIIAHVSSLVVFFLVATLTAIFYPFEAAALGLVAAFVWMGLFKFWRYRMLVTEGMGKEVTT